jgi:hypothetical protein
MIMQSHIIIIISAAFILLGRGNILAAEEDVFGKQRNSEAALIGTIYDLKQTQQRQPSGYVRSDYSRIVEEFLNRDWDESLLNRYFRSGRALYTTQIFVPMMGSGNAPKAFGVEKLIQPSAWLIHYKGQVSPPEDGIYRFVGGADDVIAAAVNGKTVLVSFYWGKNHANWQPENPKSLIAGQHCRMIAGDWMTLKKDQPIDLDVLIGEWPGGQFQALLLYQKQGQNYPTDEKGNPILPIFQLAPYDTPEAPLANAPRFLKSPEIWKCYQ